MQYPTVFMALLKLRDIPIVINRFSSFYNVEEN